MSLVSSTAFQYSPALQARAFISLGTLANMDVDEDLFFQMLVAFKTALSQTTEADTTTIVSMLKCFVKVVPHLPSSSRFCFQLFWLAVSLLESAHMSYYVEATELLQVTLLTSLDQGGFDERGFRTHF
jgi:neurofibromin 1